MLECVGADMGNLEKAITLAIEKHSHQVDKTGEPFIGHSIRVMASLRPDEEAMMVGVLHDIVEDTDVTLEQVRTWFGEQVWVAVLSLTRPKGCPYREYLRFIKSHKLALKVKLADLRDNMRPERNTTSETESLQKRYKWAKEYLES